MTSGCETGWHPFGPLRIAVDRLRVVDSSVMPTMCSPNTYAPSVTIGEKAADLILNEPSGSRLIPMAQTSQAMDRSQPLHAQHDVKA